MANKNPLSKLTGTITIVPLFACVACTVPYSGDPAEGADDATSTTAMPTGTTAAVESSGSDQTTAAPQDGTTQGMPNDPEPFEQAASLACDAHLSLPAVEIPNGSGAFLENGFRLGNEFPHRFLIDFMSESLSKEGDYLCFGVYPSQETEENWWFEERQWLDYDGVIRVYMVTRGVEDVVYHGGDNEWESPLVTQGIRWDVDEICPALPNVWFPDPNGFPDNARRICMLPNDPDAEAVFVRVN